MVKAKITCLVNAGAQVGEGPVWDPVEAVLWWTDINGRLLHRFEPRSGRDTTFDAGMRVGSFALREQGGLVLAAERGFWFWEPGRGAPEHLFDVEGDRPDNRMNDGGCDRQGRFFAASMNLEASRRPTGACWRLMPNLSVERIAEGLTIGNGVAFSPAGDRFFLADTTAGQVWTHAYDGKTGAIGERLLFADLGGMAGLPDGATCDAEGGYWLAAVRGGRLYRFLPDGALDRSIDLPISAPTKPSFGGEKLDRIFVTSIRIDGETLSGGLFAIDDCGFQGLPEPRFAG